MCLSCDAYRRVEGWLMHWLGSALSAHRTSMSERVSSLESRRHHQPVRERISYFDFECVAAAKLTGKKRP